MTRKVWEPRQPKRDESKEASGDGGPKHPKRRREHLTFKLVRIIETYHWHSVSFLMTFMMSSMRVIYRRTSMKAKAMGSPAIHSP